MELAIEIWNEHIEVFEHFDLVCHNGESLEDETRSNALFNSIVTLNRMHSIEKSPEKLEEIEKALEYLKGSRYYSDSNQNSDY